MSNGIKVTETGAIVMTGEGINTYRLLTIRMGLKAEKVGMRLTSRAPSCKSIVKKEFGIKDRDINVVIQKYDAMLRNMGILKD